MKWRFMGICGWLKDMNKSNSWALMRSLKGQCFDPWLCASDFKEIFFDHEKKKKKEKYLQSFRFTDQTVSNYG